MAITDVPILIDGVGTVNVSHDTTQDVVDVYNTNFNVVTTVFNTIPGNVTAAEADSLNTAVTNLLNLAKNGIAQPPQNGINVGPSLITSDMGQQIDLLVRSLASVGMSPGGATVTGILRWQDLTGLSQILATGADAGNRNRSLQALLELEYVGTGNQVLGDQLNSLYQAMTTTQGVTQTLTSLLNIHNMIMPEPRTLISTIPTSSNAYDSLANALYQHPLALQVNWASQSPANVVAQMSQLRTALASELSQLNQLNPPALVSGVAQYTTGSVAQTVSAVLTNMQSTFGSVVTVKGLENWILDGYASANFGSSSVPTNQGAIQSNLDAALLASTNINNTQQQDFQRYLFVFQEFYQSASSMLTTITQDINQMAQNIGR